MFVHQKKVLALFKKNIMKKTFAFLFLIILCSCSKTLDLSTLVLGSNAEQYDLEHNQNLEKNALKGHYEWKDIDGKKTLTTVDNGEIVTNYHEVNKIKNQFNYLGIPTDSTWDVKIVVYKDKIAEVNATFSNENSFKLIEKLLKNLGEPTKIYNETTGFGEHRNQNIYSNFKKYFPKSTNLEKDSIYVDKQLTHPINVLWDKENNITTIGIYLDSDDKLRLVFGTMSKKAYFDRVLYPVATENSPFYDYLK
jgi:hypothetical protein